MSEVLLPKEYEAAAASTRYRFAKHDSSSKEKVRQAAAATDAIVGVLASTVSSDDFTAGKDRIRVDHAGIVPIEAGAAFDPGALLTADSNGKAVAAAPAAGVNNRIGAIAIEEAGADGDIVRCQILLGQIQGA